jgi:hypothetical protein
MIKLLIYMKSLWLFIFLKYFRSSKETLRFPEVKSQCPEFELERVE